MKYTRHNRWPLQRQAFFLTELGQLVVVGYSLKQALDLMMVILPKQKKALIDMQKALQAGDSFAVVLRPYLSTTITVELEFAQLHGDLVSLLRTLGGRITTNVAQWQRLKQTMCYPICLLSVTGCLMLMFVTYIFPLTKGAGVDYFDMKTLLFWLGIMLLLAMPVTWFTWWTFHKMSAIDRMHRLIELPMFGPCYRMWLTARFGLHLGLLLQNGVGLAQIIEYGAGTAKNSLFRELARLAKNELLSGGSLMSLIQHNDLLPAGMANLFQSGRKPAAIGADLQRLAEYEFDALNQRINRLINVVQPVFFVVIAMIVISLYAMLLIPMYAKMEGILEA